MKKKLQIAYITAFLALCAAPLVCMPFVKADESAENRKLSEMPSLIVDGKVNSDWGNEFETYFSEHFAFRSQLVTLDSLIKSDVFKTSSNEKVVVGKDDWLYFAETLDDYTGAGAMSERRLYNTAKTISLMQEKFEADGRKFLFFSAPNKSSVYPENMPSRYVKYDGESNIRRLSNKLDEMNVPYIEIAPLFLAQDKTLYLTRDSHWTNEGALLAFNAAADALGMEHKDFAEVSHSSQRVWHADLDGMLFPTLERLSNQEVYDYEFTFDYRGAFSGEDDMTIKTKSDGKGGNLLMYRDSFGRAFYPFAAENASKAIFSRTTPYKTSLADEVKADFVILEIVERNLKNITASAPVMEAPAREDEISAVIGESDKNICEVTEKGKNIKVYGKLDESFFTDTSDIYVSFETDEIMYEFEAFPIYEAEFFEDEAQSDYGYSMQIAKDTLPSGEYGIYVYVKNGDEYICTGALRDIVIS